MPMPTLLTDFSELWGERKDNLSFCSSDRAVLPETLYSDGWKPKQIEF